MFTERTTQRAARTISTVCSYKMDPKQLERGRSCVLHYMVDKVAVLWIIKVLCSEEVCCML